MNRGKSQARPNRPTAPVSVPGVNPFTIRPEPSQVRPTALNPGANPYPIGPSLGQNKYSALAHFPPLNPAALPQSSSSNMLVLKKPFSKDPESSMSPSGKLRFSQKLTSDNYAMKEPENFAEAVSPMNRKDKEKALPIEKETFEIYPLFTIPILALDKELQSLEVKDLLKPVYHNRNYVDTDNALKTRRYFEFILIDTGSIEIEHELADQSDQDSIAYSKFTIKKILSPSNWLTDHLLTPINLSKRFNPQTFNWFDYKNAWMNFLFVRPNTHSWFIKYCIEASTSVIPRWFYEWWSYFGGNEQVMPKRFRDGYLQFQVEENISTLPEHIKLCKYFFKRRLSYIVSWTFCVSEFDRIKYLSKETRIKGWSPKVRESPSKKPQIKSSPSKSELKKRLEKALSDLDNEKDNPDQEAIEQLLEQASSQSDDNGDMLIPKALAQSYLNPFD